MAEKAGVQSTSFPPGAKVELYERTGDFWDGPGSYGKCVKKATVKKDSTLAFTGLEEGKPFWLVAEVEGQTRAVACTSKIPPKTIFGPEPAAEQREPQRPARQIVRGPRTTLSGKRRAKPKKAAPKKRAAKPKARKSGSKKKAAAKK